MKNKIFAFCCLMLTLVLSACSSIPDYASKPKLNIDSIVIAERDGVAGFNLELSLYHRSTKPLKLEAIQSNIFMNNKLVSNYLTQYDDKTIDNLQKVKLNVFVPANKLSATANHVLANNPLLVTQVSCAITLIFFADEANSFNPSASFEGFVSHE